MNWILVGAGLLVHLIFFYSIFDIYFTSPLVHGMTPHASRLPAPAKRVVLFVADGLRADKLFQLHDDGMTATPFLRSKIEHDGSWGISHTRVPTESRPGHVALIAGFYEDVSAVAKGWKENPVEFDSVFNESRHTWSWGSPDILPMFSKGATGNHVSVHMYPGHSEDFAGADMTMLDTWVFDRVQEFFQTAVNNETLVQLLQQDKLVFFLHLLGLDTSGHVKKPHSREYQENLRVVDRGVDRTVRLIEEFFQNDKKTAYVFTSDHGMTDWGSHGAGHPSETLTPLICWGAGIRSPLQSDDNSSSELQRKWKLGHIKRYDVNQADISALMSILIGVSIPLQSVGQVPLDYLSSSAEFKAESISLNALQILEQFEIKMQLVQKTTLSMLYTPFKQLMPSDQVNSVRRIRKLINEGRYEEAIDQSKRLIDLSLEGLAYYHRYDRLFLGVSITAGFVGWMAYIVIVLIQGHTDVMGSSDDGAEVNRKDWRLTSAFVLGGIAIALFLQVQSLGWTYFVYTLLPVVLWHQVFQRCGVLRVFWWYVIEKKLFAHVVVGAFLGFVGLELIILSFFYRELMSLGLIFMAFWPLQRSFHSAKKVVPIVWSLFCCLTSIFPLLPIVDRAANYPFVYLAGLGGASLALIISFRTDLLTHLKRNLSKSRALIIVQIIVLLASIYIVWNTVRSLDNKTGLPLFNQGISWIICCSAFVVPLLSSGRMPERMLTIMLCLFAPYLLLSTSYESLFYLSLCVLMVCWIPMEYLTQSADVRQLLQLDFAEAVRLDQVQRKLVSSDLRCAYFFIFFLLLAFFGTGNIASINTFDPTSVLCFVTVFNPFVMGALMLTKMLIPLLLVTCAFNAVHLAVNVPTQSLFLLVLLMSDFMALHFFFLVKDYGSWLEIGTSISHYVVVMAMISFLFILLSISKIFTDFSLRLPALRGKKPHKQ